MLSAGIDWVEDHVPEGVTLCNAGDTRSPGVAQWVVAAILADLVGFQRAEAARLERSWERWQPRELAGKRVVIVGHGSIGRAVERRLAPFGVRIGRVARRARQGVEPVERLARRGRGRRRRGRARAALGGHARAGRRRGDRPRCRTARCSSTPAAAPVVDTDALVAAVCRPGGSAPRSTSPIPSRCRRITCCGRSTASSSRRTTRATRRRRSSPRRRWRARRCCATARACRWSTWSGRVRRPSGRWRWRLMRT